MNENAIAAAISFVDCRFEDFVRPSPGTRSLNKSDTTTANSFRFHL